MKLKIQKEKKEREREEARKRERERDIYILLYYKSKLFLVLIAFFLIFCPRREWHNGKNNRPLGIFTRIEFRVTC